MIPRWVKAAAKRWREPILPAALRWLAERALRSKPRWFLAFYLATVIACGWLFGLVVEVVAAVAIFAFAAGAVGGRASGEIAGVEAARREFRLTLGQRQAVDEEQAAVEAELERQAKLN